MATVEHCLYCFETLSATLEKRRPMSLSEVRASWAAYPKGLDEADDISKSKFNLPINDGQDVVALAPQAPNPIHSPASSANANSISSSTSVSTTVTPSESSSTSSSTSSATTSSSPSFSPIGVHPRHTSQRLPVHEAPLFVTWNTTTPHSSAYSLRGCIGTFESSELTTALATYALTSAMHDTRFPPICAQELPSLSVAVTLLTDFEKRNDPLDWQVGVHGIRVSFFAKGRRFSACYLPDVAVEQGWLQEECLLSCMRKAGWNGKRSAWRDVGDLHVTRFQGFKESVAWAEWKAWRDWATERQW